MTNDKKDDSVVLHIPHASTVLPHSERPSIILSDSELDTEILAITDWFTDELFCLPGSSRIVFPVSRLVVDPERFSVDEQEPQATVGRGVIYTDTIDGKRLRGPVSGNRRTKLLDAYYHPHHAKLTASVEQSIQRHGRCLIIDCHSFPATSLPYELDGEGERFDVCIGTDSFHTSAELTKTVVGLFNDFGYSTSVNTPFSGSLVPMAYFQRNSNVESLMIELNRSLYMNEQTGKKDVRFERTCHDLSIILGKIRNHFALSCDSLQGQ
jgi:N-formylglutamate deformylase